MNIMQCIRYTYVLYVIVSCTISCNTRDVRSIYESGIVGPEERTYIQARENNMETARPRVAICCSGGGPRAMIATSGLLTGLEKAGLLQSISYMSALSGSTWAIFPWLLTNCTVQELREHITNQLDQFSSNHVFNKFDTLLGYLITQSAYYHRVSLIDLYGAFLADTFLRNILSKQPLQFTSDDFNPHTERHPFPICSCIIPKKNNETYAWVEITPYEVGSHDLGYYTPISYFGSKFQSGYVTKPIPPPTVGYLMGICGSAISASLQEMLSMYLNKPHDRAFRLLPAKMPNFTRGLEHTPFRNKKKLTLVDAGIDMNLPIPPLIAAGRDIDVIIVCDAAGIVDQALELRKAAEWARSYGKPLPPIDFDRAASQSCSIFESDHPHTPTIIYLPRIKNPSYDPDFDPDEHMDWHDYLNTFNFSYSKEQAQHFAGLIDFTVREYADAIIDAIERKSWQLNNAR